jgi:hypothetical protein
MNARYQDPVRGQFISEDPAVVGLNPSSGLTGDPNTTTVEAFLNGAGQTSSAYLDDPQALNFYSYGRDNPLRYTDPSGKCIEDGCYIELASIGFASGAAIGLGGRVVSDLESGHLSSPEDYAISAAKGGAVGVGAVSAAYIGAGAAAVGLTAAAITGTADIIGNGLTHRPDNWIDIGVDAAITGVTGGLLEGYTPKVPGRIPNLFSNAFFAGSHMINSVYKDIIDQGAHSIPTIFSAGYGLLNSYVVSNNTTYVRTGGGGLQETSLPSTVTQGGTTYYRNSSGLLSTKSGL